MNLLRLPNMDFLTKRKWSIPPLLLAFLVPFLGMTGVMIFRGFYPFGHLSVLYSDMYHQYYPFFVDMRETILSGEGLQWTWSVGMGMDYLGLFAYYLASPLNFLSLLLPDSMVMGYFSMLLPIKLGFAGLFFALFLKKIFGRNDWSIVLFGAFYATCAWALGYQWNIMWVDAFALLPLIVWGMISLLEKRKFMLYTLTLFLAVFSNYYAGFFVCIFIFLAFICYEICKFKSIKKTATDLALMAVFSLLALGMTLVLELPAYVSLQNTQSSVNTFPEQFKLNMVTEHNLKGLFEALGKVAGNMNAGITPTFKEGLPNVYSGAVAILLGFFFITSKEIKLRDKICNVSLLIFFMLSFAIRQLDYIWHGFHFTNMIPYRFSFLFSFVLLVIAYRAFLLWKTLAAWQILTAAALSIGIVYCSPKHTEPVYMLFNVVLLALYVLVFTYHQIPVSAPKKMKKEQVKRLQAGRYALCSRTLAGIMIIELILNLANYGMQFAGTDINYYPKNPADTNSAIAYMEELEKDTLFYRAETTHNQSLNDGALNGYNGISTFSSSAYVNVTEFMQALGYPSKNTYNRYCFEESSPVANLFLNLKYMLERDGRVEENSYFDEVNRFGNVALLENNAYLPLGFLANEALADVEFVVKGDRFLFQNDLLEAASGVPGVWSSVEGSNLQITADSNVTLSNVSGSGVCNYKATSDGKVTFSYYPQEEGFFCIDIDQTKRNSYTVRKNGTYLYGESYSLPQMIAVSDVVPGDRIDIVFTCKAGESGKITIDNGILNQQLFRQAYSVLEASTLDLTEFSTTYIAGTITCDRDGLLYTSIPQTGNWYATVDGQPVETQIIGGAMAGLYLTEGTHTVTFTYRNTALTLGAVLTTISALTLIALWVIFYKPYDRFLNKNRA